MGVDRHTDATKAKMRAAWVRRRAALSGFWDRVEAGDCWVWTGSRGSAGYGQYMRHGRHHLAHRFAWTELVGEIPAGMTIDHLCRNRLCVNPDHLEIVSVAVNTMRGMSPIAIAARRGSCAQGHPMSADNVRIRPNGRRRCRTCETAYETARRSVA